MAFTVTLTPDLERRLIQEASHKGITAEAYALHLLDKHISSKDGQTELMALLFPEIDESFDITQDSVFNMEGYDSNAPADLAVNLDKYIY